LGVLVHSSELTHENHGDVEKIRTKTLRAAP